MGGATVAKLKRTTGSGIYRVDLRLLTYLWNEGFEKAEQPWLRIYTDNGSWVRNLPNSYSVPERDGLTQDFEVRVKELAAGRKSPTQEDLDDEDWDLEDDEELEHSARFFALTPGLTTAELDGILQKRISGWDGV